MRQILINLLVNSTKFTTVWGITLNVDVVDLKKNYAENNSENITLFFEVKDTGVGIAEDEIESVFKEFEQTKSGLSISSGTGLGIPLTKEYVKLLGGELKLQSQVDIGTTFRFTIQVKEGNSTWLDADEYNNRVLSLQPDQKNKFRILIAGDIEANYHLLSKLLVSVGFLTKTVQNGKMAVEAFHSWKPHLILMDLKMPVLDGLETTKKIKATPEGKLTSIIMISASVFLETRIKVFEAGCNDFIVKPFKENILFQCIGDQLGVNYVYESEELIQNQNTLKGFTKKQIYNLTENRISQLKEYIETGNINAFNELLENIVKKIILIS